MAHPNTNYERGIPLPSSSFFLFGPRGVGKSTWLHKTLPQKTLFVDLLHYPTYLKLSRDPSRLEQMIDLENPPQWVCVDEVQKIPALLDEIHRLIELHGLRFALSGSSARKLKHGGGNLLAGRAIAKQMETLSSKELGSDFNWQEAVAWGTLPLVQKSVKKGAYNEAADILETYVSTYLREEIREEGLIRKIDPFLRFLEVAGVMNGEQINVNAVAQQAEAARSTVETYFAILEDTLLTFKLHGYRPRIKVREQVHPKLYWFDSGVARASAGLVRDPIEANWEGKALETLLFHELRVYNQNTEKHRPIYFYRAGSGQEIDFLIETEKASAEKPAEVVLIEVKRSESWNSRWERPILDLLRQGKLRVKGAYGIYTGKEPIFKDKIRILPVTHFLNELYKGKVF